MYVMKQFLSILLIMAVLFMGFILWQRAQQKEYTEAIDDATVSDRCAEFRQTAPGEESEWSLGYGGRIRQLLHGCF